METPDIATIDDDEGIKKVDDTTFEIDRLNVVEIHLPPLHGRREDIVLLARHFLTEACRKNEIELRKLHANAEAYLSGQTYPGNVRQLRNLMERLAILAG